MGRERHVSEITFQMVVDGRRVIVEFHRKEKIEELLNDNGTLGDWLRALRDTKP